jgi:hypothetical protein
MDSPVPFAAMLQATAALVVFVVGWLGVVLCAVICLFVPELISERDSVVRDYGVKPV